MLFWIENRYFFRSKILPGTAWLRRDMKWVRKSLCNNFRFNSQKNHLSTANIRIALPWVNNGNWSEKKIVRQLLDGAAYATCLSSLAPYRWQFKIYDLFLSNPVLFRKRTSWRHFLISRQSSFKTKYSRPSA